MNAVPAGKSLKSGGISVDRNGKRYYGEWRVENGMLRVSSQDLGFKETSSKGAVGGLEGLARVLLDELAVEKTFRKSG
jgi:hypothetical protein